MKLYVAFFRGLNVGGAGRLPMAELRALLEELGAVDVKTYIQSGNAVFRHRGQASSLEKKVRSAIESAKGFAPQVLLVSEEFVRDALEGNPFPEAEKAPKTLHLFFLAKRAQAPDLTGLESALASDERIELHGRVLYLHAPSGLARSKFAAKAEKLLGVPTTARNWRTCQKVLELAGS